MWVSLLRIRELLLAAAPGGREVQGVGDAGEAVGDGRPLRGDHHAVRAV